MNRILALLGILALIMFGSIFAQRGVGRGGAMQIAQGGTETTTSSNSASEGQGASESCAHLTFGSYGTAETEGAYSDEGGEDMTEEEMAEKEMYEEMQAEGPDVTDGSSAEEATCEYDESGKLICYENGKPIYGCVETADGYVDCP